MTVAVVGTAVGAGLVVYLAWPRDPLSRLRTGTGPVVPSWWNARETAPPPRTRAAAGVGVAAVALVVLGLSLPGVAVVAVLGPLAYWAMGRVETAEAAAVRAELVAAMPGALDVLAACVAAGMPLRSATAAVAGSVDGLLGARLSGVVARAAAGFGDAQAWAALSGDEVLGPVARDLSRAADAGTAMGAMLERHAERARAAAHADALARARAVGVRSIIPVSVCYLPAFFLLGVVPVVAGVIGALLR